MTVNSGDNDGYESGTGNACASGSGSAHDNQSGTSSTPSCSDPGRDRHLFWNYGAALPSGATVNGISVRLDAWTNLTTIAAAICVELSWDGGTTWTAAQIAPLIGTAQATYLLGSASDLWGHAWTPAELANGALVVRLTNSATAINGAFDLDWVAIAITYTP